MLEKQLDFIEEGGGETQQRRRGDVEIKANSKLMPLLNVAKMMLKPICNDLIGQY